MTKEQIKQAADAILRSQGLLGTDMYLPKIFVVNGDIYYFLNAARRAAFGTEHPIEVMTIEEAYKCRYGFIPDNLAVAREFNQEGDTFAGRLFMDEGSLTPQQVYNPIIRYSHECNP